MRTPQKAAVLLVGTREVLPAWIDVLQSDYAVSGCSVEEMSRFLALAPTLVVLVVDGAERQVWSTARQIKQQAPASQLLVVTKDDPPSPHVRSLFPHGCSYFLTATSPDLLKRKVAEMVGRAKKNLWERLQALWRRSSDHSMPTFDTAGISATTSPQSPVSGPTPDIKVNFLGGWKLLDRQGKEIVIKSGRLRLLMAYLLYHRTQGVRRSKLIAQFWSDVSEDSARNSLNVAISTLRRALNEQLGVDQSIIYEASQQRYRLVEDLEVASDLRQYNRLIRNHLLLQEDGQLADGADATPIAEALQWCAQQYGQGFLSNQLAQEWVAHVHYELMDTHIAAISKLIAYYINQGEYQQACITGEALLQADNCIERVHRQLMFAYYKSGRRSRALQQYQRCEAILREELDASPSDETKELLQIIRQQQRRQVLFPLI